MEPASLLTTSAGAPSPLPASPVDLAAAPGRVLGLVGAPGSGLTRLALTLVAEHPGPVAVLDVRGWLCPTSAWEAGIDPENLVVVRCGDRAAWPHVAASLVEGFPVVYAEVPPHLPDAVLRRLAALTRARRCALILRPVGGDVPSGVLHLRLESVGVAWEGVEQGHGALTRRRLVLRAGGKGARGVEQVVEMEDDGTHPLRVVPRLAAASPGLAAG